ncbi:hypothetical protein N5J43_00700 [Pseudomonas nicosulfuronedens]|uniref:hypothetical protein n=1 Tax=Pseudomonas nicosulfuronedens TaxID=2571105 RepID=UPI0024471F98|nr:hypothetical protein [Pseudomonas nicosulfuronedens]MDH1007399.1 hypothetical protein [Pseudomonas nicosulfuronedens]MDH1977445.1 hypothetical protein [Pseudomonas nicosulfuronedens]MDH2029029.1 hypothetical protein [Pseudomonas nicosulfuronedens]
MSSDEKYTSEQVQRVLRVLLALASNEFRGLLLKEVAIAAECTNDNALRALENLRTAGLAERGVHDDKRWQLGPRLVQIAFAFDTALQKAQRELDDRRQRFTRTPN